ncbi:biopolymer transporter ExbD [Sedimentitalea sp. JM2-8]|uniref:Biopolymer transporter ExbD n=1 Tax=Sedimentitalea xiamensis TaxID=3050037 RepID=A0ABT7FI57_9RHOB|nr:biopolymer transporter ExbD [Sedimentitalea xiamensis]MDK3074824.1 biopolymer transporter ExbD [Sedimentitalea xiamensis]
MAGYPTLRRPRAQGQLISLVPMIDVMLILLVFFMVTSTYLDLDMIPAVRQRDATSGASDATAGTVLIRLASDGVPVVRGVAQTDGALAAFLAAELAETPLTQVLILPSGAATTQSLISVMDTATRAGATRLRVIRLEARP